MTNEEIGKRLGVIPPVIDHNIDVSGNGYVLIGSSDILRNLNWYRLLRYVDFRIDMQGFRDGAIFPIGSPGKDHILAKKISKLIQDSYEEIK